MDIEECCICHEPTGRAGPGEDSLYISADGFHITHGPYCELCYEDAIGVLNDEILKRSY